MATFYSKQTGNWEDGANWASVSHTGAAGASPGTKGTDWPGSGDTAVISAGHIITVTTDLSAEASAILLQCDAPGTNTGTLKFLHTATTGLKATLSTINASSTFNLQLGTRTTPIRRGNTCALVATSSFTATAGVFNFEAWGQHREHSSTDVYCDILTSAASANATSIVVNGDWNPAIAANDWIWIVERDPNTATISAAELVQVDTWTGGTKTATLKTPLKYSYTTTNALVFKAKTKLVNTILASDHTSGANYVLEDDLYPSGTGGGNFLVKQSTVAAKTNTLFPVYSSYNSGTKTLTAGSSSSTIFNKGSVLLMDDFNVSVTGTTSLRFGATNSNTNKFNCAYMKFNSWLQVNERINAFTLFNSNLIDCFSLNAGTDPGYSVLAYGLGTGVKSSIGTVNQPILTSASAQKGHIFERCRMSYTADSSTDSLLSSVLNSFFNDCVFDSSGDYIANSPQGCSFKNCSFGNTDNTTTTGGINQPANCSFQNCWIYGIRGSSTIGLNLGTNQNILNNIVFGQTLNGRQNNNAISISATASPENKLFNGITFDAGESSFLTVTNDTANPFTYLFKFAKYGGVTNQFRNYTPGGFVSHDTSGFRTAAPSIKFTHSASGHPVWFDIPVYLGTGAKTISIYTNPSTGSWTEAPRILLLPEENADSVTRHWQNLDYLATAEQTSLSTGTYTSLTLNYTVVTAGIYIVRLWAKNGGGTVNFDDFTVA